MIGLLLVLLGSIDAVAQNNYEMTELPNAPLTSRHNDLFFRDNLIGWIVDGDGEIHKTADGGNSWDRQYLNTDAHFRSIGFISDTRGFAGNVGEGEFGATDENALFETFDGGETWTPVTNISGPTPKGICGMFVVNDSTVVAVGRVRGPAFFVKTTDGGQSWTSIDMSEHAAGLIDVYFTHPDSGFVAGLTDENHTQSSGVILRTTDGGVTWEQKHKSARFGEWIWKMSWPSRNVGYASLQRNSDSPIYILKTTDGGETWVDKRFSDGYYFVQGIGFVNEKQGWIGGNSTEPVYTTSDGGETWQSDVIRPRLNRFRFLGDSLGFAVGRSVYRIRRTISVGVDSIEKSGYKLSAAFPNPFQSEVTIYYELPNPGPVTLAVYDATGREIVQLVNEQQSDGTYAATWNGETAEGARAASGVYYVTLRGSDSRQAQIGITQTVVLAR